MKFQITQQDVRARERMPKGYGRAYHRYDVDVIVCYPIPINLIVRWANKLKWWMLCPMMDREELAYQRGYSDGRQDEREKQWNDKLLGAWNDSL